jgi:hypothetical protein
MDDGNIGFIFHHAMDPAGRHVCLGQGYEHVVKDLRLHFVTAPTSGLKNAKEAGRFRIEDCFCRRAPFPVVPPRHARRWQESWRGGLPPGFPQWVCPTRLALSLCARAPPLSVHLNLNAALFHHLITGQDAPKIGGRRVLRPHLRPLRIIAMPRARLEVAERFVVHPV